MKERSLHCYNSLQISLHGGYSHSLLSFLDSASPLPTDLHSIVLGFVLSDLSLVVEIIRSLHSPYARRSLAARYPIAKLDTKKGSSGVMWMAPSSFQPSPAVSPVDGTAHLQFCTRGGAPVEDLVALSAFFPEFAFSLVTATEYFGVATTSIGAIEFHEGKMAEAAWGTQINEERRREILSEVRCPTLEEVSEEDQAGRVKAWAQRRREAKRAVDRENLKASKRTKTQR